MSDIARNRVLVAPLATVLDLALHSPRLARALIHLYRRGIGSVTGSRPLMLQHAGRRTGAVRQVVLEVVDHPARDVYVVASGFGERAQWYFHVVDPPGSALPMIEVRLE